MTRCVRLLSIAIATICCVAIVGCDTNRHAGDDGQLIFEYYSTKDRYNFNKPVIEEGYLDVFAYDIPENERVTVEKATSLTPKVARIEGRVANLFVVEGRSSGRAKFEVRARNEEGQLRVDTFALRIDRPTSVHFDPKWATAFSGRIVNRNPIGDEDPQLEVTAGSRIEIPWTRRSSNGEPLVGYGVYPVEVDPPEAAEIHDDLTEDESLTLRISDTPQTFDVVPKEGYDGDEITIEIVDHNPLDRAAGVPTSIVDSALSSVETDLVPYHVQQRTRQVVAYLLRLLVMWIVVAILAAIAIRGLKMRRN